MLTMAIHHLSLPYLGFQTNMPLYQKEFSEFKAKLCGNMINLGRAHDYIKHLNCFPKPETKSFQLYIDNNLWQKYIRPL